MQTRRGVLQNGLAVAAPVVLSQWKIELAQALQLEGTFKAPDVKDLPLMKLSDHVMMIQSPDGFPTPDNQGMMANIIFVVGANGVVAVDTGASLQIGEMAIRQLRKATDKPVIGIINTHYHGDHWLGNHAFVETYGAELKIYSSKGTRGEIEGATGISWRDAMLRWTGEATAGTRIVPPRIDIEHGFELSLGDVTLRAHHYGQAHTPSDIAIEVVQDGVMCVGDIMMDRRIANMEDGSYKGTLECIDLLIKNSKTRIWVPAHGEAGTAVLEWQRSLFAGIYESCTAAVKQGVPLEGALAVAMKDPRVASKAAETKGWERNIGKYVSIAYLEAEQAQF